MKKESLHTIAVPPGETIKELLTDRGMTQKEFAARMDMSEKHISKLLNGDVHLTVECAVRLEMVLGITAQFWLKLETVYRENLERVKQENELEEDIQTAKNFAYTEMSKLGWVPAVKEAKAKVIELRKFFEVTKLSLLEKENITKIACRRLKVTEKADLALLAWAQEAKLQARKVETAPINIAGLIERQADIRSMTTLDPEEFCPKLCKLLAEVGVALIFMPHIKGSFLHGATFYDGKKIVLGLTVRGKYADVFWFSLFHELGHIIKNHIARATRLTDEDELAADKYAQDTLIEPEHYSDFLRKNNFSQEAVKVFADKIGINAGIVVGRLQRENKIKYNCLTILKTKYEMAS